jgi:uncharacterized protein YaaN involved in tellurite resistance
MGGCLWGLEHSRQATAAQNAVNRYDNELLKRNADYAQALAPVETAREAERSIIDIQTLQHTNAQLIFHTGTRWYKYPERGRGQAPRGGGGSFPASKGS